MAPTRNHPPSGSGHPIILVAVVSRASFYRQSLVDRLGRERGFRAIDLGTGGPESASRAAEDDADLILVDLPLSDALALAEAALGSVPGIRPIAVLEAESADDLARYAEAGFVGFIQMGSDFEDLVRELGAAMRDEFECSPRLAALLLRSYRQHWYQRRHPESPSGLLSARERQVVMLMARNLSNKEIAAELGIEFGTAKNHVQHILEKLKVHHRWEVVRPERAQEAEFFRVLVGKAPRRRT